MTNDNLTNDSVELISICYTVRELIFQNKSHESEEMIRLALAKYPHAPEPHNLMGIQLEKAGDHLTAMKHFRAAYALDPTYLPARYNMEQYADVYCKNRKDVYFVDEYQQKPEKELYKIEYDEKGNSHIIKRDYTDNFFKK
jgi:tetratricopeptide (TPR) repeat protein